MAAHWQECTIFRASQCFWRSGCFAGPEVAIATSLHSESPGFSAGSDSVSATEHSSEAAASVPPGAGSGSCVDSPAGNDSSCGSPSSDSDSCDLGSQCLRVAATSATGTSAATQETGTSGDGNSGLEESPDFGSELCPDSSPSVSEPGHDSCASRDTLSTGSFALTPGTVTPSPAVGLSFGTCHDSDGDTSSLVFSLPVPPTAASKAGPRSQQVPFSGVGDPCTPSAESGCDSVVVGSCAAPEAAWLDSSPAVADSDPGFGSWDVHGVFWPGALPSAAVGSAGFGSPVSATSGLARPAPDASPTTPVPPVSMARLGGCADAPSPQTGTWTHWDGVSEISFGKATTGSGASARTLAKQDLVMLSKSKISMSGMWLGGFGK